MSQNKGLSYKLFYYIIGVSLCFTLLTSSIQLWMMYKDSLVDIRKNIEFVKASYIPSITDSLYVFNTDLLRLQLQGVLQLPYIEYIEVTEDLENDVRVTKAGDSNTSNDMVKTFPLVYKNEIGQLIKMGNVRVVASYKKIYEQLKRSALVTLGTNGIQIFLVSFFLFLLIQTLITRHLKEMARYAEKLNIDTLGEDLTLNRSHSRSYQDELDQVVNAFNRLQHRLLQQLSERKTAEEALRSAEKAQQEAETANRVKSEFLSNMSHEIRTPMNAILGYTEILQRKEKNTQKAHFLKSINTSGKTLLSLINDVLDLSKIESGKLELQYSSVSLNTIFQDLEIIFSQKIQDKGLNLMIEIDQKLPKYLVLDENRIRQVLINLLGNAVKFTEHGYIKLAATCIEAEPEMHSQIRLIVEVKDTGMGISKEDQEGIFEAFEQIHTPHTKQLRGTGLGLAISKRLIEMMGGTICIDSILGQGATFIIDIKEVEVAAGSIVKKAEKVLDFSNIEFESATILIVDDIDYNRELLSMYLEDWNFDIVLAKNGKSALEKARELNPDLILLDMRMPVMDGYEASMKFKKDPVLKKIPIVAVTASALHQDEDVIRVNCDGYLRKPVSRAELINEIITFLPHQVKDNKGEIKSEIKQNLLDVTIEGLPETFLEEIRYNVSIGDFDEVNQAVKKIRSLNTTYFGFCDRMEKFTQSYDGEAINAFIDALREHRLDSSNT